MELATFAQRNHASPTAHERISLPQHCLGCGSDSSPLLSPFVNIEPPVLVTMSKVKGAGPPARLFLAVTMSSVSCKMLRP